MGFSLGRWYTHDMTAQVPLFFRETDTPLGRMIALADDAGVRLLEFCDDDGVGRARRHLRNGGDCRELTPGEHPHLLSILAELSEFFAGERQTFSVPLAPLGTEFQRRAWSYLRTIPFGETRTYGQQARALRDPAAVRAVGRANGANPLAIIVPCHRVIGAAGDLVGYAGGLDRKRWLLEHEQRLANPDLFDALHAPLRRCASRRLVAS